MAIFNWVFQIQPIALGIIPQPSRYKKVESNLLADEKVLQQGDPGSCSWLKRNFMTSCMTLLGALELNSSFF